MLPCVIVCLRFFLLATSTFASDACTSCELTDVLPFIGEFLTQDLRYESLSQSTEEKRRRYANILQSFEHKAELRSTALSGD